jgi:hypothetical protein
MVCQNSCTNFKHSFWFCLGLLSSLLSPSFQLHTVLYNDEAELYYMLVQNFCRGGSVPLLLQRGLTFPIVLLLLLQ